MLSIGGEPWRARGVSGYPWRRRGSHMDIEQQNLNLGRLADRLSRDVELAKLRGTDAGAFMFASHKGRAVELSWHEGKLWIEYWEADDDEPVSPVKENEFGDIPKSEAGIRAWLPGQPE